MDFVTALLKTCCSCALSASAPLRITGKGAAAAAAAASTCAEKSLACAGNLTGLRATRKLPDRAFAAIFMTVYPFEVKSMEKLTEAAYYHRRSPTSSLRECASKPICFAVPGSEHSESSLDIKSRGRSGRTRRRGVSMRLLGGAVAQLGARLDVIDGVVGSNPIGSTNAPQSRASIPSNVIIAFPSTPFHNDAASRVGFCTMARLWLNSPFSAPQER